MTSTPASIWSRMARRTASSYASCRSVGPSRAAAVASRTRKIHEGNACDPHTVVGRSGSSRPMTRDATTRPSARLDLVLLAVGVAAGRLHGHLGVELSPQTLELLARVPLEVG